MWDCAIVGGGPAGAAAALTLAHSGRRVLLCEKRTAQAFKLGEGLPPVARVLLSKLGVWPSFIADGHLPSYGNASSWGVKEVQYHDFIHGLHGHGWHLDRMRFDSTLRAAAVRAGATLHCPESVVGLSDHGDHFRVTLEGEEGATTATARWLLDTSGRAGRVARRLGASLQRSDRLMAVAALYASETDDDRDTLTRVASRPHGWWYTAAIPGRRRVAAYLSDTDLPALKSARSAGGFRALLHEAPFISQCVRSYRMVLGPFGAAAGSCRLSRFGGERWLTVGDAAMRFDPLSSQGIVTAIHCGMKAAEAVDRALDGDERASAVYQAELARIYAAYHRNRMAVYRTERRWPEQPFWRRRLTDAG